MCGIAGFIDPGGRVPDPAGRLDAMVEALAHRGPDARGTWVDVDRGVYVGHTRLKIIDLSGLAAQPMISASGRYVLTYNGEVYNFKELARELSAEGAVFRGSGDTEVVLTAFEHWGVIEACRRFVGMFALALYDRETGALSLARDRFGIKPLYYGRRRGILAYGSELKPFMALQEFPCEVDVRSLASLLSFHYVPTPHSILREVSKVVPGGVVTFGPGDAAPTTAAFWDAAQEFTEAVDTPVRDDDVVDEAERVIKEAISCRLISDVPLGAFLSGGIDSTSVVALMQELSSEPVRTFTVGFEGTAHDESGFAAQVARHLGTAHTSVELDPNSARDLIPELPRWFDEPFADSSGLPAYLVAQTARRHVTVALSGDGGDEVFGGYNRYVLGPVLYGRSKWMPRRVRSLVSSSADYAAQHGAQLLAAAGTAFFPRQFDGTEAGSRLVKLARALEFDDEADLYLRFAQRRDESDGTLLDEVAPYLPRGFRTGPEASFAKRMAFWDSQGYMCDDILTKVDRATMAVSLEARVPLMDHRVVRFGWRLPDEWRIRGSTTKVVLREILARRLPREWTDRPKSGFSIPLSQWLRTDLEGWVGSLLSPEAMKATPYLDASTCGSLWQEHREGKADHSDRLWPILMYAAWLDEYRGTLEL